MSKIAFIYPGQGAQKVGMGQDFYENEVEAKAIYDQASDWVNLDMKHLCFEENDQLNQTSYTQAAMVTTCLAMTEVVKKRGIVPDVAAGLSLGEYCAIACAGGMTTEDAVKLVRTRGILMEDAVPEGVGAMSAVLGMEGDAVETAIQDIMDVFVANYNCPGQVVITGSVDAVGKAEAVLKDAGAKRVMRLNVSGPFHSKFLVGAGRKLGDELRQITMGELTIPYVTNVTATYVNEKKEICPLLERQVYSSVLWEQSIRNMIANGVDTFIEIGPGKTLAGFMKKIDKSVTMINIQALSDIDKALETLRGEDDVRK